MQGWCFSTFQYWLVILDVDIFVEPFFWLVASLFLDIFVIDFLQFHFVFCMCYLYWHKLTNPIRYQLYGNGPIKVASGDHVLKTLLEVWNLYSYFGEFMMIFPCFSFYIMGGSCSSKNKINNNGGFLGPFSLHWLKNSIILWLVYIIFGDDRFWLLTLHLGNKFSLPSLYCGESVNKLSCIYIFCSLFPPNPNWNEHS